MTKTVDTLVDDIHDVLDPTKEHGYSIDLAVRYSERIGAEFVKSTIKSDSPRAHGKLWASDLGKKCLRQHWYNFNAHGDKEPIDGHTKFKFLYGNILEEASLYYAEEAGHSVAGAQSEIEQTVNGWTVRGRVDAVVDGVLLDVKSTSSFGYKRYKEGINSQNDSFGYLYQLGFYFRNRDQIEDVNVDSTRTGFLWIDKQNGSMCYTDANVPAGTTLIHRAENIIEAVEDEEDKVPKAFAPEPYGKSGNMKLPISCSYCPFKQRCWADSNNGQGLKGFLYSHGPVWMTEVHREPNSNVPRI